MSLIQQVNQASAQPVELIPEYDAQTLTENGHLAKILLDEKCYYLRITRQGKLILTK